MISTPFYIQFSLGKYTKSVISALFCHIFGYGLAPTLMTLCPYLNLAL